ncbi:MAG: polyprenyl synthetase family protein [Oligoflexales bacterium]
MNTSSSLEVNTKEDVLLLSQALLPVYEDLQLLKPLLKNYLAAKTESGDEILQHVFASEGKLVRPAMFFLVSRMLCYRGKHLMPIAAVCEYVHTASLLHDDVVDNSQLRRNKPTSNSIWGDEAAVLVGDLIYSTASELMANTGYLEVVKVFASSIKKMSEGELLQLEHLYSLEISQETYFAILGGKTAVLMGAACRAAGILAEANKDQKEALEGFGYSLGVAFQLIDDALDYRSSQNIFGKEIHTDLYEGKVTLPLILLQECAKPTELASLRQIFAKERMNSSDVEYVAGLVERYKTAEQVLTIARNYTQRALDLLTDYFPPNEDRAHLENLANSLVFRSH